MTVREWLAHVFIGPKCSICYERFRGWRMLIAHTRVDHADEVAR